MSLLRNIGLLVMESNAMKSKFRGCLLGSLLGDCMGAPYEGDIITSGDKIMIQRYFDKLEDPEFKAPYKKYTDDTAMTKSVAKFLTDKPEPDYNFLAKLFVNEYFNDPRRGYGQAVVEVFHKLRNSKYADVFKPAGEQFLGSGSYGNGGAMRIAPVALYFHDNYKCMIDIASNVSKITHTNTLGINGALLQSIAIQQAFFMDPKNKIDVREFCNQLYNKIKEIEADGLQDDLDINTAYQEKVQRIEHLLEQKHDDDFDDEVIIQLGNGISAYESVPTAIYCFLRAQDEIPRIETDNIFRRTIQYAITLGGDTDTIASMAGAIAGAYVGEEGINTNLIRHCEFSSGIVEMADNLLSARESTAPKKYVDAV